MSFLEAQTFPPSIPDLSKAEHVTRNVSRHVNWKTTLVFLLTTLSFIERSVVPGHTDLPPDILGELQSTLSLHSFTPEELYSNWESYYLKMGPEETKLDLTTAHAIKKRYTRNAEARFTKQGPCAQQGEGRFMLPLEMLVEKDTAFDKPVSNFSWLLLLMSFDIIPVLNKFFDGKLQT